MEPTLYTDLAAWWPLLSAPEDYAEEAGFYRDILLEAIGPTTSPEPDPKPGPEAGREPDPPHPEPATAANRPTLLELGSGGGNNASHLKAHFHMTLVDRAPGMLTVSRQRNPGCEHHEGDMRDLRLSRLFDAVFIHDAIMYLTTEADLARAIETAFAHCRPGGVALLVPDCFRETFRPDCRTGGHDGDGRSLRYLEWSYDPDPTDTTFITDFAIMLRPAPDDIRVIRDRHVMGLFPRARWLALSRDVGFEPEIRTVVHSDLAPAESELIVCRKP
jgi:hypothetical protein